VDTDIKPLTPLVPLDSPELKHGPYTDEQFQYGQVAVPDCGTLYGYRYQPEKLAGAATRRAG
jgi:hypothetical protein